MNANVCSYPLALTESGSGRIECGTVIGSVVKLTLQPNPEEDLTIELYGVMTGEPNSYCDQMQMRAKFDHVPDSLKLEPEHEYDIVYNFTDKDVTFHRS